MAKKKKLQVGGDGDGIDLEVITVKVVKSPWTWAAEIFVYSTTAMIAIVVAEVFIVPMFA